MEGLQASSKTTVAIAAGGASLVAFYVAIRAARASVRTSARRGAASPTEFHLAVHVPGCPKCEQGGPDGLTGWILVKHPRGGTLAQLKIAIVKTCGLPASEAEGLCLYPVAQRSRRGEAQALGENIANVSVLDRMLAHISPEKAQIVEIVCAQGGASQPALSSVPPSPPTFPLPGISLPFIGTTYHLLGPESVYSYNIRNNVFPPGAPAYPHGATVRSYSGGAMSSIDDFPEGSVFHQDARTYTTWSADAQVAQELIDRGADFPKLWNRPAQKALQDFTGNGLFTSSETSEDWQVGHSLLPRGFNQIKVKSFAPQILAKTRTFIRAWASLRAGDRIENVNDWLTAMTADAVVSCSMGLDMRNVERMGSGQPPHPFVDNFRFGLGYSGGSITEKDMYGLWRFVPGFGAKSRMEVKYAKCKKELAEQVDAIVEATRAGELGGQNSIIRSMLEDKASSGKHVRYGVFYGHVVNLMIAGHETTAATLGFTMQLLAENPECEARALEEVRSILGGRTEPSADDVPKLQYVEQCFREALRLYSPVAMISRDAAHDTLLAGHRVFQGERINIITHALHTNPAYWGGEFGDPLSFNPDRFAPEAVRKRHPNAYHPWGFGNRACIGSQFALFEAKTFLASMLLHFRLEAVPGYRLKVSFHAGGAAPSPNNLAFIVYPRPNGPLWSDMGAMRPLRPLSIEDDQASPAAGSFDHAAPGSGDEGKTAQRNAGGPAMQVLYGSNTGASQQFAGQVASAAGKCGFRVATMSLDAALGQGSMSMGPLAVIVTSTYNGQPPDNATQFKAWLGKQTKDSLRGLRFAVFGLGNSQWHTYQQFPREVDAALQRCGAECAYPLGACDVDSASFESDFDDWLACLLEAVGGTFEGGAAKPEEDDAFLEFVLEATPGSEPLITDLEAAIETIATGKKLACSKIGAELSDLPNSLVFKLDVASESRELCQKGALTGRSVRHITLRLPEKAGEYRAGDHLEITPPNDPALVAATLDAIGVDAHVPLTWNTKNAGPHVRKMGGSEQLWEHMPSMRITAGLVLQWVPDLSAPPTRKACARLAEFASSAQAREELESLGTDSARYNEVVAAPALSFAELLQRYKGALTLTIGHVCAIAKPMAPRFYSVSSSPAGAADPRLVTISVGQVCYTTGTGRVHKGLMSTHLASLGKGSIVPGRVRKLASNFHVPSDALAPMLMVGPGTGVAPMMGFLQEREHLLRKGVKLGPAVLFFGCRKADEDYMYREELGAHLQSGALSELHVAFSREASQKVYVQDKIREQKDLVWKLLQNPKATVYVCGDARAMAPDVKRAFQQVVEDCGGKSESAAANMIAAMVENSKYLEDVWAS